MDKNAGVMKVAKPMCFDREGRGLFIHRAFGRIYESGKTICKIGKHWPMQLQSL
ncbi:hypothetical protein [Stenotrophomonas terrae]|uniref:hypothetical protein n=1 Tax=Stenotrophomonas terrae TaxID=405446 RepID=UPI00137A5853|nr:hypothetical protein [Stenotrophomonas terrae]